MYSFIGFCVSFTPPVPCGLKHFHAVGQGRDSDFRGWPGHSEGGSLLGARRPAPDVEAGKFKAPSIKKKSKGGVSIKPLYREMVVDAIVTQNERLGSSLSAIKNHLSSKYEINVKQKSGALNRFLNRLHISPLVLYLLSNPLSAEEDA